MDSLRKKGIAKTIYTTPELWREFKLIAVRNNYSLNDLANELIEEFVNKNKGGDNK